MHLVKLCIRFSFLMKQQSELNQMSLYQSRSPIQLWCQPRLLQNIGLTHFSIWWLYWGSSDTLTSYIVVNYLIKTFYRFVLCLFCVFYGLNCC